jgi:hypothetical protein
MFFFCSHIGMKEEGRRFPPPWTVERQSTDCFAVRDANGLKLAVVYCRDDLTKWTFANSHLTSDEARRIANGIARLPQLLAKLTQFKERSESTTRDRYWNPERPYHVALEDSYVRRNYDDIVAICRFNKVPFDATGEKVRQDGALWCIYAFENQFQAVQFWMQFEGRWMRGDDLTLPQRPAGVSPMRKPSRLPNAGRKDFRN